MGDMDAEFKVAHMLSVGFEGQPRDVKLSVRLLEQLAGRDHPLSQYILGMRLIKNERQAEGVVLIEKAASAGHPTACTQMGHMYKSGIFVERDPRKALEFLERAAAAGGPASVPTLGESSLAGSGLVSAYICKASADDVVNLRPQNREGTIALPLQTLAPVFSPYRISSGRLWPRVLKPGVSEAAFLAGTLYASGDGVERDSKRAMDLYLKAANQGLAAAQHNVASLYFQGDPAGGVPRDVHRAVEYWSMAAEQSMPLSLFNLGKLLHEGYAPAAGEPPSWRVRVDRNRAAAYLRRAVEVDGENGPVGKEATALLEAVGRAEGSAASAADGMSSKAKPAAAAGSCVVQ
ncbi:hypothetical protein DFJ73DRAFT_963463 [Zopfochytrium polystomum]|nr:hypothetical protein DFJ73DRAFT_963463 [Zopfochytrium polystomum]